MPKKVTINTEIRPMIGSKDRYLVRISYVQGAKHFECKGDHDLGMSLYDAQHLAFVMRDHIKTEEA